MARAFGTTPGFWLALQASYDTEVVMRDHGEVIEHIQPLAA
jgi:plasmid maintenance system antidote protein VapI